MNALFALTILVLPASPAEPGRGMAAMDSMDAPSMKSGWKRYDYDRGGKRSDEIPSGTLVVIALAVVWGVLLLYVILLHRRLRDQREELAQLRRQLDVGEGGGGGGGDSTGETRG